MSFSYTLLRLGKTVGVTHDFIAVKKMEQDNVSLKLWHSK